MERLTEKHYLAEDHYMKCSGNCHMDINCIDCPAFDRLVERLAAYEDTGLTPEEVAECKKFEDEVVASGKTFAQLVELLEADKEGRVVVLPCKVGDTIYFAHAHPILQYTVTGYDMGKSSILHVRSKHVDKETGQTFNFTFSPKALGDDVFLTREEAERALEGQKNGNQ